MSNTSAIDSYNKSRHLRNILRILFSLLVILHAFMFIAAINTGRSYLSSLIIGILYLAALCLHESNFSREKKRAYQLASTLNGPNNTEETATQHKTRNIPTVTDANSNSAYGSYINPFDDEKY